MKNIFIILIIHLFFLSCIDIIKSSDEAFYESVHVQGGGWFKFYENEAQDALLELTNDFTLQIWFSGQEEADDEAACIALLKGDISDIAIYRNPNVNNIIMIYENGLLIKEFELENMNLSEKNNFYLLSIIREENEMTVYMNDSIITNDDDTPLIKKTKFLVPRELTVAQFMSVVRKKIDLSEEKALFFYVNNFSIPNASEEIQNIYYKEKDEDQFLYFTYCAENTFG